MEDLTIDFCGVGVRLIGLRESLAKRVREEWGAFVADPLPDPLVTIDVGYGERVSPPGPFEPRLMEARLERERAEFALPQGRIELDGRGAGRIELARELGLREFWTLANFVRASLAWRLPVRRGAMLHAAGLIISGRAFLLIGPGDSGKSTWARLGQQAGCAVLSDDVILLDGANGRLEALGSPFRSTHRELVGPGRWPLAAILFPRHGSPPAWSSVPPLMARARITANLPFIADGLEGVPVVGEVIERLAASVPCRDLTFGLDPGFVDLLRSADL